MQPVVSVIIPTYNRASLVIRAVRSALAQDFGDFEIIVVDDASTDNTPTRIDELSDNRLRYLRLGRNVGAGAARNHGLRAAKGKFIAFLDSDDVWLPHKLSTQLKAVADAENEQRVFCFTRFFFDRGDTCKERPWQVFRSGDDAAEYLFCEAGTIHTSTILVSRALCDTVVFQAAVGEDTEFTIDMQRAGAEFIFVGETLSFYHSENRPDRFSLNWSGDDLLALGERLRPKISARAFRGYLATTVAPHLIAERKFSSFISAGRMICSAIWRGALSRKAAANVLASLLLPPKLHVAAQQWKAALMNQVRQA